jgi:hypothetical protein
LDAIDWTASGLWQPVAASGSPWRLVRLTHLS